jgi:hypothetical protein
VSIDVPAPFHSIVSVPPRCSFCWPLVAGDALVALSLSSPPLLPQPAAVARSAARQSPATVVRFMSPYLRLVSCKAPAIAPTRSDSIPCECSRCAFSESRIHAPWGSAPGRPVSEAISAHRSGLSVR